MVAQGLKTNSEGGNYSYLVARALRFFSSEKSNTTYMKGRLYVVEICHVAQYYEHSRPCTWL
jgi:hypothetical protein